MNAKGDFFLTRQKEKYFTTFCFFYRLLVNDFDHVYKKKKKRPFY